MPCKYMCQIIAGISMATVDSCYLVGNEAVNPSSFGSAVPKLLLFCLSFTFVSSASCSILFHCWYNGSRCGTHILSLLHSGVKTDITTDASRTPHFYLGPPTLGIRSDNAPPIDDAFMLTSYTCCLKLKKVSIITPRYLNNG